MKRIRSYSLWIVSIGFLLVFPLVVPSLFYINNMVEILINALFGVSLNLLIGYTGLLSLGHNAFFAIGSYSAGVLLQHTSFSIPTAFFIGLIFSGIFALFTGYFSTRLTKFYFAFLTLAFSQIIYIIIVKWVSVTGGYQGLTQGIPKPPIHLVAWSFDIVPRLNFYYFTVVLVCGSFILCKMIVNSPFGWILRCIRESPLRAQFIGINVRRYQIIIFVIAGVFCAVSGSLSSLNINGCYPEHADWLKGADPIFMILIGGMKNFLGPIVGAIFLLFINTFLSSITRFSAFFLGVVLIILIIFTRMGIVDLFLLKKETWRKVKLE